MRHTDQCPLPPLKHTHTLGRSAKQIHTGDRMYAHNGEIEGITIKKQTLCLAVHRQVCVCVSWVSEVNDEDHSGCDWPDGSADSAGLWVAFRSKVTSLQTSATIRPSDQSGPAQEILLTGYRPSLVLISA